MTISPSNHSSLLQRNSELSNKSQLKNVIFCKDILTSRTPTLLVGLRFGLQYFAIKVERGGMAKYYTLIAEGGRGLRRLQN